MRRIVGTVFQTLDGVMQAPGGDSEDPTGGFAHGGWQMGYEDAAANARIGKAFAPPYALLLGRRTYEIFASYWPYVEGEMADLGKAFTSADKFVLTRSGAPLEWENSRRLTDLDTLAEVKHGDGPELRIWGSTTLYPQLLTAGLLDELNVFTFPLVLGEGKKLFGDGTPAGGSPSRTAASAPPGSRSRRLCPVRKSQTLRPISRRPTHATRGGNRRSRRAHGSAASLGRDGGSVTVELYGHPFAAFAWKALIAAYERDVPFRFRTVDPGHPDNSARIAELSPTGQFPALVDGAREVTGSNAVIEYLDRFGDAPPMIPADPQAALTARMMADLFDDYIAAPMQRVVAEYLRPDDAKDPHGASEARQSLDRVYAWFAPRIGERWAAGGGFSIADCAAAPALFYADWVQPIPDGPLKDYRTRLLAYPSVARVVDEARPFRKFFPPGAPHRD